MFKHKITVYIYIWFNDYIGHYLVIWDDEIDEIPKWMEQ